MSLADLPEEALDGLMLNAPELDASEDLRHLMLMGALFAGDDGRRYVDHLIDTAWEPPIAETAKKLVEAADNKHGRNTAGHPLQNQA